MILSMEEVQKMKVVELRAELTVRNLDVRGVKAVLVERLLDALESEQDPTTTIRVVQPVTASETKEEEDDAGNNPTRATRSSISETPKASSPVKSIPATPEKLSTPTTGTPAVSSQQASLVGKEAVNLPNTVEQPKAERTVVSPTKLDPSVSKQPASLTKLPASPVKQLASPMKQPAPATKQPASPVRQSSPLKQVAGPVTASSVPATTPKSELVESAAAKQATLPQKTVAVSPAKPAAVTTPSTATIKGEEKSNPDAETNVPATGDTNAKLEPGHAVTAGEDGANNGLPEPETMDVEEGREDKKRKLEALNGNQIEVENEETRKPKKFKPDERKNRIVAENEPDFDGKGIVLDWYKSDLNLKISEIDFLKAEPIVFEEFPWAYAGVKATHGFTGGKICFEVKWVGSKDIKTDLGINAAKHILRIGWSDLLSDLQLGEEKFSYGYDSSGKFYVDNEEPKDGGETFEKDDVVAAYLDFESDPVEIQFSKNGTVVGTPIQIPKANLEGKVLFPHILVRNANFETNFGSAEPAHPLLENYQMVGKVGEDEEIRVRGPKRAENKGDCEFIMLCGMACSGKTRWSKEKKLNNPELHFNILGTSTVVERVVKDIAVTGLLMKAGKFVEKLVDMAPSRRRNYILDQSNILTSVQRRKAGGFEGFKRRAVVILPSDEEYQNRIKSREQEQGKSVPKSTVLDMKAGFRLPEAGDLFNEVEFPELGKTEAEELVSTYNKEGVAAGFGQRPLTVRGGGPRNTSRGARGGPRGGGRGFFRGDPRGGRGGWRGPMGRGGPPPFRGGPPPRGFRGNRFPRGMAIPSIDRVSREPSRGYGRGSAPRGIPSLGGVRRGGGPPRGLPRGNRGGGSWDRERPLNGGPARSLFPPRGRGGPVNRGGGSSMYNNGSSWGGSPPAGGFGQGRFSGAPGGFGQARFGGSLGNANNRGPMGGGFQNQGWGQGGNQGWDRGMSGNIGFKGYGGGGGGNMGNQFADPWSQQVPDQGYGQSWDNNGGGLAMSGNARGGGTWQGYGGQTYGNYSGGYGRK